MPARTTVRSEILALARLALPLSVSSAGQALLGVVDTAVTGRAGAVALAGTGLGNLLFFAVAVLGIGTMMGLDPLVSQAVGGGDHLRARRLLWQGVWMAVAIAALLAAVLGPLPLALAPLGIEAATAREAGRYLLLRLPGLPALLFFFGARAYLQSCSATRPLVIAVVVANVLNLGLDVLFVFGGASLPAAAGPLRAVPAMGAAGAALATTVVTWVQAALLALAAGRLPHGGVRAEDRLPVRRELALAMRLGIPVGLHMGAEVGIFALVGFLAGRLGRDQVGAHQIALALASLTFTVVVGVGQAASVRVGWAIGARDTPAARRSGLVAFGAGATFMSLSALAFLLFPAALARLMSDDPQVVATAAPLLVVAAFFQISDATQAIGAGVLRGAGDTRFTFAANMVGHWAVGFPIALALGVLGTSGIVGLWWGLCAGLTAVAAALLVRFLRISSRAIDPVAERAPRAAEEGA